VENYMKVGLISATKIKVGLRNRNDDNTAKQAL